jgi:hypothetical protein
MRGLVEGRVDVGPRFFFVALWPCTGTGGASKGPAGALPPAWIEKKIQDYKLMASE